MIGLKEREREADDISFENNFERQFILAGAGNS